MLEDSVGKLAGRNARRRAAARILALSLVSSTLSFAACNRAVPDKAETKNDGAGQPAGILAGKLTEDSVMPPDVKASQSSPPLVREADSPSGLRGQDLPGAMPRGTASPTETSGAPAASQAGNSSAPGVSIENVTSLSPGSAPGTSEPDNQGAADPRIADRSFMKLELPKAALNPDQLIAFLVECDRAVQELAVTRQANQLNEKTFLEQAKRLSSMKLAAGERLYADTASSVAQRKTAIAAQVESLSQLTGLGDVEAAQKLLQVAGQLSQSPDPQLAHQGRLVLVGFRLNQLVEGQIKDPQVILDDVNAILDKSEFRGLVELLALQQSLGVLTQLGYTEQANQVQQRIVKEFRNSPDRELAMRSWMIEVGNSAELKAVHEAIQNTLAGTEKDTNQVAEKAAAFIKAFPSLNTAAYFLKVIVDLEYSGQADASRRLSNVVAQVKSTLPAGPLLADIDSVLDGQNKRLGAVGKPLVLEDLTGMDGVPFDWSKYRNKVVLVYFWASWELPSMNLVDQVKKLRERVADPNFEIVGICTDDGRTLSSAEQYVSRQAMPWRNVRSSSPQSVGLESKVAKALGVNAYSHFALLVDRQGNVRSVHPSFENLDSMIAELLK